MIGAAGNDSLEGGLKGDTLIGGTCDDVYFVDKPDDIVSENPGEGIDRVNSTISYALPVKIS